MEPGARRPATDLNHDRLRSTVSVPAPRPHSGRTGPDEPLAVIVTGPAGAGRRAVLAALLETDLAAVTVPDGSYLAVGYGRSARRTAYVPGSRQPHSGAGHPTRPPRRTQLTSPNPMLRHFGVVDCPDTASLGVAGVRVLLEAAARGGAVLFVIGADQSFDRADLDLLTELAATGVEVFFAVTPGAAGWPAEDGAGLDPVAISVDAHRVALLASVPALADAPWLPVPPGDAEKVRRALVCWSSREGLRRASQSPPEGAETTRRVSVAATVAGSDWAGRFDSHVRAAVHRLRQNVSLELANIHLRVVREIVFCGGPASLAAVLDRELHALSLLATAECDATVDQLIDDGYALVFGGTAEPDVRRRIIRAVSWGLAENGRSRDTGRVLLVTTTGGIATLSGPGALAALDVHPAAGRHEVLPPVGLALSGSCYQHWRAPENADQTRARIWSQRALREIELELLRDLSQRVEAVRLAFEPVLADAVDHGILLA
ncbi:hypothetical protein [Melissospora conviva]|uniref:hypothetical protein n=1 Tax=Melissospora conviva TaxID=3388432 RepID=UPI003C202C91